MKKLLVMLATVCLLAVCASAESGDINWNDVEPVLSISHIDGAFDSVANTGLKMFVPSEYKISALDGDALYNGYIYGLETADYESFVNVWNEESQWETLDDYVAYMRDSFSTGMEFATLNGIPAVSYVDEDSDMISVTLQTRLGITTFEFYPASEEHYRTIAGIMIASIQTE